MKSFFNAVVIIMITAALVFLLLLKLDILPTQNTPASESSSAVSEMSLAPVSTLEQSADVSEAESIDISAVSEGSQESAAEPSAASEASIVPESLPDESETPEESTDKVEKSFGGIKVVLTGFAAEGLTVVDPVRTVTVRVSGTSAAINVLSSDVIIASLDVSVFTKAGTKDIKTAVSAPDGITVESINPKYISVICTADTVSAEASADTSTDTSVETSTETSEDVSDDTSAEAYISEKGIIIDGTRAMEQFGGSAKGGAKCAAKLNEFKQKVGDGVTVYALAIPTSSGIYAPDKYPSITKTAKCFEGLKNALDGVIYVDALTALTAHKDEYIYFRTDHHWAALGAYYASQAFAQAAGVDFTELDGFTKDTVGTFVGSMYKYSGNLDIIKDNPDTLICYVPKQSYECDYYSRKNCVPVKEMKNASLFSSSKSYTRFMYGDSYIAHIITGVKNGRRLIVFKESYGNALAPFLISSFEEVYIIDMRYFELNALDFIKEKKITDVCFAMCSFTVAGSKMNCITKMTENRSENA